MPALPPTPSMSSPKVTSTLADTEVLAEGLKKFTPAETSPHTSCRSSLRVKVETRVAFVVVGQIAPQAADHERLHGGAGPGLHASADTEAEAASDVWIVAERHLVAAEGRRSRPS